MKNKFLTKYMLKPGYLLLHKKPLIVYGVLGSAVFIGLWDKNKKYSGCCTYLYPSSTINEQNSTKYGNIAIPHLIKKMQNAGSEINNLKAHIIGGSSNNNNNIGEQNLKMAFQIFKKFNIEIYSQDFGGKLGRKYLYDSETGQAITMKIHNIRKSDWFPYK